MNGRGPHSMTSVFARFREFESASGAMERSVAGVRFWPLVRFAVFSKIVLPGFVEVEAAHPDFARSGKRPPRLFGAWQRLAAAACRILRERVLANPLLAFRRRAVLVSLAPRVTRLEDGRTVRVMTDFFLPHLDSSCAVLEFRKPNGGYVPRLPGPKVFAFGRFERAAERLRASGRFGPALREVDACAARLAGELSEWFGIDVSAAALARRIARAVALEAAALPLMRRMLRRMGVRCLVTAVHYNMRNMVLAHAAHGLGIPVVELQHGTVYTAHAAYNLVSRQPDYMPDWMFTWGDYWGRQTANYALSGCVSVGYPYLEHFLGRHPRKPSADGRTRILFVSQGTVGGSLAALAVELSGLLLRTRFDVVFKLHPDESLRWRELYPCLLGSQVVVVDNASRNVYTCFEDSDAVVGVCSTAIIEGFMWGLRAYIVKGLAGADTMAPFCDGKLARYVETVEERARCVSGGDAPGAADAAMSGGGEYFRQGAARAVAVGIDRIAKGGAVSERNVNTQGEDGHAV